MTDALAPLKDHIIVQEHRMARTQAGIILPDAMTASVPQEADVLAIGPETIGPLHFEERIVYTKTAGVEVQWGDPPQTFLMIREPEILWRCETKKLYGRSRVLVRAQTPEGVRSSGLYYKMDPRVPKFRGIVLQVTDDVARDPHYSDIQVGCVVIFGRYAGVEFPDPEDKLGKEPLLVFHVRDLKAVFTPIMHEIVAPSVDALDLVAASTIL